MKTKLLSRLFVLAVVILSVFPSIPVQAEEIQFPDINMELTVPDQTVILTKDTPDTDEKWKTAGIAEPKDEKKSMNEMGVLAVLFDPQTNTTVRLMQKNSSKTKTIFNLSLLSEEELNEFLDTFIADTEENAKATIEKYSHPEVPFYRYGIEVEADGTLFKEVIYGTVVNGYAVNFDIYSKDSKDPIDESFMKELVASAHFTEFLDKADLVKQERSFVIRFVIFLVITIGLITALVISHKKRNRKLKAAKTDKTDALTKFYIDQKKKEEQNVKDRVLYINRTKYTEVVVKDFCYYNELLKKINVWISMAICFILILVFLYYSNFGLIGCGIAIVLLFAFIYYQGIRIEKLVNRTMKMYDKNKSPEAVFTFYEDYFTLSGIQYISKYPYIQVTEIKEYKDYIYLYNGTDKAFYLKKDGFESGAGEFIAFIKELVKNR